MTSSSQALGPPSTSVGPVGWLRHNLFGSIWSGLTTLVVGTVAVIALFLSVEWALTDARWDVVTGNLKLFLIGTYPFAEAWRVWLCLVALSVLGGLSASTYGGGAVRTLVSWLAAGQAILALLAAVSGLGPMVSFALVANAGLVWLAFIVGLRVPVPRRLLAIAWLVL